MARKGVCAGCGMGPHLKRHKGEDRSRRRGANHVISVRRLITARATLKTRQDSSRAANRPGSRVARPNHPFRPTN